MSKFGPAEIHFLSRIHELCFDRRAMNRRDFSVAARVTFQIAVRRRGWLL